MADLTESESLPEGWSAEEYEQYLQEAEAEETPVEVAAPVEEPVAPTISLPLLSVDDGNALFTPEEQEQLNEMVLNGNFAEAQQISWQRQQQAMLRTTQRLMQAQAIHTTTLAAAEREMPELFRLQGNTIRQTLAMMPAESAGTEEAQLVAMLAHTIYEVKQGGEKATVALKRLARTVLRNDTPATPLPASPSSRVAPSSSRGSGGVASAAPRRPVANRSANVMAEFLGISDDEATGFVRDLKRG